MPIYDYYCEKCDRTFEVVHGMNDKPSVQCPECRSIAGKIPSLCNLGHGGTAEQRRHEDRFRREGAMRIEMKERYGVEKVRPLGGQKISDIYADIKSRPGFVNERMAQAKAESERKRRDKAREWKRKAIKRATPRRLEADSRRAAEAQAKRAIRI